MLSKLRSIPAGLLLGVALLLYVLIYLPKLDAIPQIAMDEGWNVLYAQQEFGKLPYTELQTVIQYKLFFIYYFLVSLVFKLFGATLWSIRFFSFLCGFISLFMLYRFSKLLQWSTLATGIAYTGFIVSNMSIVIFRWGRPEALVSTLFLVLLYAIVSAAIKQNLWAWALAGCCFTVMLLSHPFSAVVVFPLALLFLAQIFRKNYLPLAYFLLGISPLTVVFFVNAFVFQADFTQHYLLSFITERLSLSSNQPLSERLLFFFNHYCLGYKRLIIFIIEIACFVYVLLSKKSSQASKILAFIGLFTFLFGLLTLSPFRRRYFCIISFTSLLVFADILHHLKNLNFNKILATIIVSLFFLNTLVGDAYFFYLHKNNQSYQKVSEQLTKTVPLQARILTPIQFWIPFQHSYTITNVHTLSLLGHDSIEELLKDQPFDYILIAPYLLQDLSPTTGEHSKYESFSKNSFLTALTAYSQTHGSLISSFTYEPYGTLFLYKL
jgi:hypothetical protein